MKFTEEKLEKAFIEIIGNEDIPHFHGGSITIPNSISEPVVKYGCKNDSEVLLEAELKNYLLTQYHDDNLTISEAASIVLQLKSPSTLDLYESNKKIMKMLSDGFDFKREDRSQKDIHIYLIDYSEQDNNSYKFVNQLEIIGYQKRIPDGIIYINGIPVVVIEFKSAIREEVTIYNAYEQITIRYKRDIPELFKYNAFCIISDGVNNKAGSFFAPYEFFYAWRRVSGLANEVDGIDSLFTLIQGMLHHNRLRDIIQNFIYFLDTSKKDEKIVCRYPQYYAARALFDNIKLHMRNTEAVKDSAKKVFYDIIK